MKPIDVMGCEERVCLMASEVVEPFETLVVKARTKITFTARYLHCSILAMDSKDGTLPPGLVVTGTYTVLKRGSKTVPVMLHKTTGSPIHLRKGQKVAQVQATNEVPCDKYQKPHVLVAKLFTVFTRTCSGSYAISWLECRQTNMFDAKTVILY